MRFCGYTKEEVKVLLASNGYKWTAVRMYKRILDPVAQRRSAKLQKLEEKYNIPGDSKNSILKNKKTWNEWDWEDGGKKSTTQEAKVALVEEVILLFMQRGNFFLRI